MPSFEHLSFSAAEFGGKVRLFPLPNLVLFPHVMQPLHVFEPRYRELLEDALAGDRMIAMALLAPGWETNYEGRPPLYPMACLGQVATFHQLDDGTYNLLLLGVKRVRLLGEFEPDRSYRQANGQLCEDIYPDESNGLERKLHLALRHAFVQSLPKLAKAHEQIEQLLASDIPLGVLTDVISFMLDIKTAEKESLLSELNVYRRAEILIESLSSQASQRESGRRSAYSPQFSAN